MESLNQPNALWLSHGCHPTLPPYLPEVMIVLFDAAQAHLELEGRRTTGKVLLMS